MLLCKRPKRMRQTYISRHIVRGVLIHWICSYVYTKTLITVKDKKINLIRLYEIFLQQFTEQHNMPVHILSGINAFSSHCVYYVLYMERVEIAIFCLIIYCDVNDIAVLSV